jgi:hypothetical protein
MDMESIIRLRHVLIILEGLETNDNRFIGLMNVIICIYIALLCFVFIKENYIKNKYMASFFAWAMLIYIFMCVMGGG